MTKRRKSKAKQMIVILCSLGIALCLKNDDCGKNYQKVKKKLLKDLKLLKIVILEVNHKASKYRPWSEYILLLTLTARFIVCVALSTKENWFW